MKKLMLLCMSIVAVSANATVCTDFDKNNNIIEYECEKQPVKTVKNNIDVVDKNGNTALCNAILNDDVEAYNTLKLQGANTEHKCVNNIPKEQYDSFIKKVVNPNKSVLSFSVGNISMGNMGWGLLGLGAAGLVAGTIFSGGGSGGGSDTETNSTPQNHISQCHDLGYTYKYSDECPNGWLKNNNDYCNDEDGITVWFKCNIAQTCSEPYRINCQNGYEEVIGDICLSGTTVYKRCVAATCEGFTYSQSQNCPEGWVKGSSCLSGTTMKYKCDTASPCYGYTASCNTGYIPITGDTCKSGNNTLVKCKFDTVNFIIQNGQIYPRLNCVHGNQNGAVCSCNEGWTGTLCDTAVDCGSDYQVSCGLGYIETNTCKSGNDTLIKCELDNEHYIEQNGQVYNKLNCEHGYQNANGCICDIGYTETLCTVFDSEHYIEQNGQVYDKLNCEHGYQNADGCTCENGWEGHLCGTTITCPANFKTECSGGYKTTGAEPCKSGNDLYYECQIIECGANAIWSESGCTCENGYNNWTEGVGCSLIPLSCGIHAYQNGHQCVCEPGYENWTDGVGCSLIELNCGTHATQQGIQCQCDSGYTQWTSGYGCYQQLDCGTHATQQGLQCQCDSGYTQWISGYGCFAILDCGLHAYQNGSICSCEPGYENWIAGVGCSVFEINDTTNPDNNYINSLTDTTTYGKHNNVIADESDGRLKLFANDNTYIAKESNGDVYGISVDEASASGWLSLSNGATGTIFISKNGAGNIYGIYTNNFHVVSNTYLGNASNHGANGNIIIDNSGTGMIYGLYSQFYAHNASGSISYSAYVIGNINIYNTNNNNDVYGIFSSNNMASNANMAVGNIFIHNIGDGDVYGIHGVYGATNIDKLGIATIDIHNIGDGDVYGIHGNGHVYGIGPSYANSPAIYSKITITNDGFGNAYGLYSLRAYNVYDGGDGLIIVKNYGIGNAYGIYGGQDVRNVYKYYQQGKGIINIINYASGNAFGMYGHGLTGPIVSNDNVATDVGLSPSEITLQNLSNGNAVGIYTNGTGTNSGTITINNTGTGTAIGIFGDINSTINNSGLINITRNSYVDDDNVLHEPTGTSGDVFGIYAKSGSTVNNSGTINITTNGNAYGIYVESGSTVTNTGTISINGVACDNLTCNGSSDYGNHIVLNGSTLYNSGVVQANTLNLNSMGGNVVAGLGSQFVIDNELSGDLNIASDVVMDGNQTTYVANNMIDAGDISKLNVRSASAMFDATIADNKHDIVMQMKDFNELTDNASLAQFLADNYAKGNGDDLFVALKSLENMSAFNGALAGLTGLNTFTQFAHEDLSAMREISFSMNNKLFENSNRDSFDISDSMGYFSFSDSHNGGSGRYGISNDKITDKLKLGYGMAMANININDGHGMNRQNKMWLFYMPLTYTDEGYELVIAPKVGFANSEYNRRGYNNMNYEGVIEKRIFGLMNDLRYPLTFGNWTIAPDLAFNAIVYDQSGHEENKEFALVIPDDKTVSIETGLGLYTKYEKTLKDGSRFKLNSGLMVYREFGDTYDIKLGMRGMDGTFSLYNNDYEYRGAASIGFDYSTGRLHVYGDAQYFMDNANYANFKGGVSYRF